MKKRKFIISLMLIITILSGTIESVAKDFALKIYFDGKNISMESETTDISWNIDNFLPGDSDTSSVTITNDGAKTATVETSISIEENDGLLDMIDLTVTNKANETVYTGKYTELKTITKQLAPGESETYTVVTSLNVDAGNEYQNKQYKVKFYFKAIGSIPIGTLTIKYVDENGEDLEIPTIINKKINSEDYNLPEIGKEFDGYHFSHVEGVLSGPYQEEGTTVIYHYNKIKYGKLTVQWVDEEGNILKQTQDTQEVGTQYKLSSQGEEIEGYYFIGTEGELQGVYQEGETIVKYRYNKIKYGKLTVQWVDKEGNILKQTQDTQEVGTQYELSSQGENIEGYRFIGTEGNLKGQYTEGNITVKYIYEKEKPTPPAVKTGRVIIRYIDEDENIIAEEILTDEVGKSYDFKEEDIIKKIPGYDFKDIVGETTGEYKEEDTIIFCRYEKSKPKTGKLIIRYVDEEDNILEEQTLIDEVGNTYEFTEEELIKEIPDYDFKKIEGEIKGQYEETDTIIYCRYEKIKMGRLIILYVDENDNILKQEASTKKVGTDYILEEAGEEIDGYEFLGVEGETVGKYKEEDTIVKYRYEKLKPEIMGTLTIKYVDENGEDLEPPTVIIEKVNSEGYSLPEKGKDFDGYRFIRVEGDLQGSYKEEGTTVTYHYNKIKYGKLTVQWVDEEGNILKQTEDIQEAGTQYSLNSQGEEIEGYHFIGTEGELQGVYKEGETIVKYRYNKIKNGKLTIQWIDEEGNILKQVEDTQEVGTPYELSSQGEEIEGYHFIGTEGELQGVYKEGETIVKYRYNKIKYGTLTVQWVDKEGNILKQTQDTKEVGTQYELSSQGEKIEGYRFVGTEGNLKGKYTEGNSVVKYIYEKEEQKPDNPEPPDEPETKKGRVIIRYVDEDGKILEEEILTDDVGKFYDFTEEELIKEIPDYDFKDIVGETTGKYKEEDTIIFCRYEKRKPKRGRVIIRYVDENENIIEEEILIDEVGKSYDFTEEELIKEIPDYDFKDIVGETTGEYKEEDTIIFCRYEKRKPKRGRVIIRYVDEDENIIEEEILTDEVGKSYDFTEEELIKEIPGYDFKDIVGEKTGEYKEEDTIIFCRYKKEKKEEKKGRLIIECIDENNKVIKREVRTEKVGTDYNLSEVGEKIEGYTFLGVDGNTIGKYKEEDTIVTYRYKKIPPEGPSTDIIELPQTGQFMYSYVIVGAVIIILVVLIALIGRKKDKDNTNENNK